MSAGDNGVDRAARLSVEGESDNISVYTRDINGRSCRPTIHAYAYMAHFSYMYGLDSYILYITYIWLDTFHISERSLPVCLVGQKFAKSLADFVKTRAERYWQQSGKPQDTCGLAIRVEP